MSARPLIVMGAAALCACALFTSAFAAGRGVSDAALAKAARDARLDQIDSDRARCKDTRRVEDWLKAVVGDTARPIRWLGGACKLTIPENPRDRGTAWCGRAIVTPKMREEGAVIEVFFDKPAGGRPGKPIAFRASMETKDGLDYMRETASFETHWGEMYGAGAKPRKECN